MPISTYTPTAKKVFLNVGLNNNPHSIERVKQLINNTLVNNYHDKLLKFADFKEVNATYKNNIEPTLIIKFNTFKSSEYLIEWTLNLCELFNQECIPIKIDNNGLMVYNNSFQGNKMKFNNKYFKTF